MFVPLAIAALTSAGVIPNDQFHWQGRLSPGQSIEVRGLYGSIHAERAIGGHAEVLAYQPGFALAPAGLHIRVEHNPGGLTFIAEPEGLELPESASTRVDFTVRVPAGVRFIGRTVYGNVDAQWLRSDASAYTVNGDIRLSTTGEAHGETINGSITGSFLAASARRHMAFSTVNGGIRLDVPARPNLSVRARTQHGAISSDFPLPVTGGPGAHSARCALGHGGGGLTLITVNGDIELRRAHRIPF